MIWLRSLVIVLLIGLLVIPTGLGHAQGNVYYVATNGSDTTGNGSIGSPWATITHALDTVPDGSTILVRPGTYTGRVRLRGNFTTGVTVRSEVPYQARLRNNSDKVITTYDGCRGITLEGFDIAHLGPGAAALVVHIDGGGTNGYVRDITLADNIFHHSYNNDILKINNGASFITVRGNMFYNQQGSDEHMDVNSVTDVVIEDNVFFNYNNPNSGTSAYVVVKDSNGADDWVLGSRLVTIRRNVFLNWEGSNVYGFLQIGEDGTANFEADDVLIENNLMLGNSANTIRSALVVMGSRDITFRHNTIVGNLPGRAYAMSLYAYGDNQPIEAIRFYNNIWADPTGTMDPFSDTPAGETASFTLDNNLYWNNGAAIPQSGSDLINYTNDTHRLVCNPLLGSQAGLVVPSWTGAGFADGSTSIRQAFERLVSRYGALGQGSPAINAANAAQASTEDILGRPRSAPDIGAVEFVPALTLQARGADRAIYLNWSVNTTLPAPSTWRISYVPVTGGSPVVATSTLTNTARAYTLTNLTNYTWYTVTLQALLDTSAFLTGTAQALPTDHFIYVPVLLKQN